MAVANVVALSLHSSQTHPFPISFVPAVSAAKWEAMADQ